MTPEELHAQIMNVANHHGWPAHYKDDLLVHDKNILIAYPDSDFVWGLRESGTHLFPIAASERRSSWACSTLWYYENSSAVHWFHLTGDMCVPITWKQAIDFVYQTRRAEVAA